MAAVVMNMYYTGLGIARSLGARGIPVIGLSAQRWTYGNFTRYARIVIAPDSRRHPEALAARLLELGQELGRSVIFPTRDDDVVFLDRFREQLSPWFSPVAPDSRAVGICLSKWETYRAALKAGVPVPRSWVIEDERALLRIVEEIAFPCVMKPIAAHEWRKGDNWQLVGSRKAVCARSAEDLLAEYATIARAGARVLLQEMIPGGDDQLSIAACYIDRQSRWAGGFNTQKVLQRPEAFGTGCIVQSVDRPELFSPTARLLEAIGFTGIAEVEYKWNAATAEHQLIEINPRPWDQHRLGSAVGCDLTYLAYRDHAGLPAPDIQRKPAGQKWIAEDAFILAALEFLCKGDRRLWKLFSLARGRRIWAIWTARDPLPFLAYVTLTLIPTLASAALRSLGSILLGRRAAAAPEKRQAFQNQLTKGVNRG
jgi:predicted ATP-grasp superfamily ATP-dependent carboligase